MTGRFASFPFTAELARFGSGYSRFTALTSFTEVFGLALAPIAECRIKIELILIGGHRIGEVTEI